MQNKRILISLKEYPHANQPKMTMEFKFQHHKMTISCRIARLNVSHLSQRSIFFSKWSLKPGVTDDGQWKGGLCVKELWRKGQLFVLVERRSLGRAGVILYQCDTSMAHCPQTVCFHFTLFCHVILWFRQSDKSV